MRGREQKRKTPLSAQKNKRALPLNNALMSPVSLKKLTIDSSIEESRAKRPQKDRTLLLANAGLSPYNLTP